jgi:hypothetical protein
MPRFGTKALLMIVTVIALWMSTVADYTGAYEIRKAILFIIFLSSASGAVFGLGRMRAFSAGFFVAMLILACRPLGEAIDRYSPDANWTDSVVRSTVPVRLLISDISVLTLATIVGFISAYIYDRSRMAERMNGEPGSGSETKR